MYYYSDLGKNERQERNTNTCCQLHKRLSRLTQPPPLIKSDFKKRSPINILIAFVSHKFLFARSGPVQMTHKKQPPACICPTISGQRTLLLHGGRSLFLDVWKLHFQIPPTITFANRFGWRLWSERMLGKVLAPAALAMSRASSGTNRRPVSLPGVVSPNRWPSYHFPSGRQCRADPIVGDVSQERQGVPKFEDIVLR